MSESRTGLYIYELDTLVGKLKEEALIPISQDNMTRKINARTIRVFINGDNDEPSQESYYSSSKIEELFEGTGNILNNIHNDLDNINSRIDGLTNTINSNYNTLDKRITDVISIVNNLNKDIDARIDAVNKSLTSRIDSMQNDLTQQIAALDTKLSGWILYGSAAPTNSSLPAGRLYIQYF